MLRPRATRTWRVPTPSDSQAIEDAAAETVVPDPAEHLGPRAHSRRLVEEYGRRSAGIWPGIRTDALEGAAPGVGDELHQ